jgi:hypothetical protein
MRPAKGGGHALPGPRARHRRRQPPTIGIDERPGSSATTELTDTEPGFAEMALRFAERDRKIPAFRRRALDCTQPNAPTEETRNG